MQREMTFLFFLLLEILTYELIDLNLDHDELKSWKLP